MNVKNEVLSLKDALTSSKDEKIENSLQQLRKLPIDFDLLLETGIGKAVNKLRSHEKFGDMAQGLVAKWKRAAYEGGTTESSVGPVKVAERRKEPNDESRNHKKHKSSSKKEEDMPSCSSSFETALLQNDKVRTKRTTTSLDIEKTLSESKKSKKNNRKDADEIQLPSNKSFDEIDWTKVLPKTVPDYKPQHFPSEIPENGVVRKRPTTGGQDTDANLFSSKKDKNKVFSGRKSAFLPSVPSLFNSCIRVLCDNIDGLGFTGGVPYEILKPVLERANAEQLFRLEDFNPYLVEDTDCLWETLAKRDFKDPRRQELESWKEVYERLMEEREKKLQKVKSVIKSNKHAYEPARKVQLALAKAPREVRRQQEKYGTGRYEVPTVEELVVSRRNLELNPEDRRQHIRRPASAQYDIDASKGGKKTKPTVAPLMAKTLKMLKMSRK